MHRHRARTIMFSLLTILLITLPASAAPLAPAAPVTRLELAQILSAGLDLPPPAATPPFLDLLPAGPARDAVSKVHQAGLMRGFGTAIGFTILGAAVIYFLQQLAYQNLPLIGGFIAEIMRIVDLQRGGR